MKLTRKAVLALKPTDKPTIYFDADVRGFGLRIMPTGAASWIVEYRPGVGGRGVAKRRLKIGTLQTHSPEQARADAQETLARVTLGGDPSKLRREIRNLPTIAELAEDFLSEHVEVKRKPKTVVEYRSIIERFIIPSIGSIQAISLTPDDCSKLQAKVVRMAKRNGAAGRTQANRVLAVLSAVLGWAGKLRRVPLGFNPVKAIERFEEVGKERYLTSSELSALGEALREAETIGLPFEIDETKATAKHAPKVENRRTLYSPHVIAAIRLYLLTGARRREILDLRWSDFDSDRGVLLLPDSKTGKKTIVLSEPALGF